MSEHIVKYSDTAGGPAVNLDITSGRVYDLAGNQIAKWEPVENEDTKLTADYVADFAHAQMHAALRSGDKERAAMMSQRDNGSLVKMDLGVGDVVVPAALPNYAAGYSNAPPMADIAAPPLLVNKPSGKYYSFAKEDAFQRALPIIGAGGAQVPEIAPRVSNASYSTVEYALGGFVSTEVQAASDAALKIRQATAQRIMTGLTIEREIRVATLLATAANWDSTVVSTLGAGFQWDGGASSDPIADLQTRMEKSWGAASAILMSEKLWHSFLRNSKVQAYFRAGSGLPGMPSLEQVREQFGLPPIYIARMKYINTSGTLDYIWGNSVFLVRQPAQMPPSTQNDVASAYTFRWNGVEAKDGVVQDGFIVREFFVQDRGAMGGNKMVVIHHDTEVMTSKFVGGLIVSAWQ